MGILLGVPNICVWVMWESLFLWVVTGGRCRVIVVGVLVRWWKWKKKRGERLTGRWAGLIIVPCFCVYVVRWMGVIVLCLYRCMKCVEFALQKSVLRHRLPPCSEFSISWKPSNHAPFSHFPKPSKPLSCLRFRLLYKSSHNLTNGWHITHSMLL